MNNDLSEINYFNNISNNNNNLNLFGPYEGYLKGNIFKNLYDEYKNYKPRRISILNVADEMLLNINQLSFFRHELNLLLDVYPNNTNALNLFNKYHELEESEIKKYERRFGPLSINSDNMNTIPFKWEESKWPWEI